MPTFEITTSDGVYEVEAANEQEAVSEMEKAGLLPPEQQQAQAASEQQPGVVSDVVQSLGGGIRSGVESLAGMAGDINQYGGQAATWLAGKLGAGPETAQKVGSVVSRASPLTFGMPTTERYKQETDAAIGDVLKHDPQTRAGEYARTVGEFLPAAAVGPGSLGKRVLTQAVLPGLGSEAAGQATKGTGLEPYARFGGAVAAGMLPAVAGKVLSPAGRISPERKAMAKTLKKEGVDLTAGQITGKESLRYRESELGGWRGQQMMDMQGEQFTKAALKKAGIDATRATPEVIDKALVEMGRQFDDIAARNRLIADQQLGQDLQDALTEYFQTVPAKDRAPVVLNTLKEVAGSVKRYGGMAGKAYKSLRSRLNRIARNTPDPELRTALRGMQESLDDAMERSMALAGSPDVGRWREVRNQYRNFLVIEQAATAAGPNARFGTISPAQLRSATVQKHGRRNFARGQGDFAELARAGEAMMAPLPNSGTASRLSARNLGIGVSSLAGGGAGASLGTAAGSLVGMPALGAAVGATTGALAGSTIPPAIGRMMLSPAGRKYLTNQMFVALQGADPKTLAAVAAILANGRSQAALPPPSK